MADKKISALTAATTPLAGTEVLPIVQSGSTVKVAVSNLTAGRSVSASDITLSNGVANGVLYLNASKVATSGTTLAFDGTQLSTSTFSATSNTVSSFVSRLTNQDFQLYATNGVSTGNSGDVKGSIGLYYADTLANLNGSIQFTRGGGGTDGQMNFVAGGATRAEVQSGGDIKINTGNLVIGTAAKGIDFSANTHAAGMTSELLNWYEEGTWTPTMTSASGTTTVNSSSARYTRIGDKVFVIFQINYSTNASVGTSNFTIGGLPFASKSTANSRGFVTSSNWTGSDYNDGYILVGLSGTTLSWEGRAVDQSSRTNAILSFVADYFAA